LDAVLLLRLLRDVGSWSALLKYAAKLPERLQRHPVIIEYRLWRCRSPVTAERGRGTQTADRPAWSDVRAVGLVGGRYKQLSRRAAAQGNTTDAAHYLNEAIDSYRTAMDCDLNDYYPSSNLPALYRQRGRVGDEALAVQAATMAYVACERAASATPTTLGCDPRCWGWRSTARCRIAAELAVRVSEEGHTSGRWPRLG